MITPLFLSGLVPWLIIMLLLQKPIQKNHFFTSPIFLFVLIGFFVAGILFFPVNGFSLAQWMATMMSCVSLPLLGLLTIALLERLFSVVLFSARDWKTAWAFGVVGSLILYPAALGLGSVDPYQWGWGDGPFFLAIAAFTLLLLITKNRFAFLLLLALAAFDFHVQESTNLWDYLVDPLYAVLAIVASVGCFFSEKEKAPAPHPLFVQ